MTRIHFKNRDALISLIVFPIACIPIFIAASKNFAKTDDYVFLGLMKTNQFSIFEGFKYLSVQEWTAGRWVSNLLLSIIFHDGTTVASLAYPRIFFTLIFYAILLTHYFTLKRFQLTRPYAVILTLALLAIPGFQSFITLVASGPYLLAILMTLLVSRSYLSAERIKFNKGVKDVIILFLVSCIYQPATFFVLMYPAINLIHTRFSTLANKKFCYTYVLANVALLLNWLSIKISFTESRGNISIDIPAKMSALLGEIWSLTQVPWTRFFNWTDQETFSLLAFILLLQVISVVIIIKTSGERKPKTSNFFSIVFILTAGIPFSFPWFFLISESSTDFRRYSFASGLAIEMTLFLIYTLIQTFPLTYLLKQSLILGIFGTVLFLYILTSMNTLKTSSILDREWNDFVCASKLTAVDENVKIRSNEILLMYQSNRPISEDFNTSSLVFQNPPTFMLWLSQFEAKRQIDFAPWNMNFVYDLEYQGQDLGKKWSNSLFVCSK